MGTALWILLGFSLGASVGYVLCAVMMVAGQGDREMEHIAINETVPLNLDS